MIEKMKKDDVRTALLNENEAQIIERYRKLTENQKIKFENAIRIIPK